MELLTVAEIAARTDKTPQMFNKWITQEKNPLPIASSSPRRVDYEVYLEWYRTYQEEKAYTRKEAKRGSDTDTVTAARNRDILDELLVKQRKLLAWSRGSGRGWALGRPNDEAQPFKDNYIEIVKANGRVHGSNIKRLLQEAVDGKVFFMDPDAIIAFLLGQLEAHPSAVMDENLKQACNSLRAALRFLNTWRSMMSDDNSVLPEQELIENLRNELSSLGTNVEMEMEQGDE